MSSSDEHKVPAAFPPLEVKIIKTQNKKNVPKAWKNSIKTLLDTRKINQKYN